MACLVLASSRMGANFSIFWINRYSEILQVDFHADTLGFRMSTSLYSMISNMQNWFVITQEVYEEAKKEGYEFVTVSANRSRLHAPPDSYTLFHGDITASVKGITLHVDLEDDNSEKSVNLAVTLGQLDLSYVPFHIS